MKKLILITLFAFFISGISAQEVRRGKGGAVGTWRIVGTTQAHFTADHDGIVVIPAFNNFRQVQIKVTDAPLRLVKLEVTYGDGAPDVLPLAINIPQGGVSRPIDLRGVGTRIIKRIDFWYDTRGVTSGKASVTILGMK